MKTTDQGRFPRDLGINRSTLYRALEQVEELSVATGTMKSLEKEEP